MSSTVTRGLDNILSSGNGGGGANFITFEEGKPVTLLIIDWYENLVSVREHYETSLNPKYIRCPGKEVCPLCAANPNKYPANRVKFRVFDPQEGKVKFVSLAPTHIKKLNADFNLDEVNPTQQYVTIYRTGKGTNDTSYSARRSHQQFQLPDFNTLELPDITPQITPHTVEEVQQIMNAVLGNVPQPQYGGQQPYAQQPQYTQPQAPVGQPEQPVYVQQPQAPQYNQPVAQPQQPMAQPQYGQQPVQNVAPQQQQAPQQQMPPRNLPF